MYSIDALDLDYQYILELTSLKYKKQEKYKLFLR